MKVLLSFFKKQNKIIVLTHKLFIYLLWSMWCSWHCFT